MTKAQSEATAYHEAGHAVAAWYFHLRLRSARILDEQGTAGLVEVCRPLHGIKFEVERTGKGRLKVEAYAIFALAGMVAQRRFRPRSCRSYHADKDYKDVVDVIIALACGPRETQAWIDLLVARTEDLLELPFIWQKVKAVAQELLVKKRLDRAELLAVLNAPMIPEVAGPLRNETA